MRWPARGSSTGSANHAVRAAAAGRGKRRATLEASRPGRRPCRTGQRPALDPEAGEPVQVADDGTEPAPDTNRIEHQHAIAGRRHGPDDERGDGQVREHLHLAESSIATWKQMAIHTAA